MGVTSMKRYQDMNMLDIPVQLQIESMVIGSVFLSKVANGLYNLYLKVEDDYVYFIRSYRRMRGKYEPILYSDISKAWKEKKYNALNVLYFGWIPYYSKNKDTTSLVGVVDEKALNLWKLKSKFVDES